MGKKSCLILIIFMLTFISGVFASGQPLYLVYDGSPLTGIVIHENANQTIEQAAADLQYYLQKMSGAEIGIKKANTVQTGMVLTLKDQFSFPELAVKLDNATPDGFAIKCDPAGGRLILMGNSPEAVSYAVYTLLESFGARWFFPGDVWEENPDKKTISINQLEKIYKPSFDLRSIWYGWGTGPITENKVAYDRWVLSNKMGGWLTGSVGHAYNRITDKAEFDEHPEWFSLVNGVRQPSQLCTTNPDVIQRAIEYANNYFSKTEDIMVSLSPNDGYNMCECENCKSLGNDSDKALYLANKVAKAISLEYPERLVAMYAYAPTSAPPSIIAEPNVIIFISTDFINPNYSFIQIVDGWSEKAQILGIREYYGGIGNSSTPRWQVDYLEESLSYFQSRGVIGINASSPNSWGAIGLNYFVASKLLWDQSLESKEIFEDFIDKCWHEVATPMTRFYLRFKDGFNARVYYTALLDLKEADQLVETEKVKKRLDQMKLYMHWVGKFIDFSQAVGENKLSLTNDLYVFTMQIAKTNLIHSYGIYRDHRPLGFPKDFEPTLPEGYSDPMDLARKFPGFTSEEIQNFFEFDFARVEDIGEIPQIYDYTYNHDHCFYPRELDSQRRGIYTKKSSSPTYRQTNTFYIYSDFSQKKISVEMGLVRQNSLSYQLEKISTAGNMPIDSGITEPDSKEKTFLIPEKGIYKLTIEAKGMGYKLDFYDLYGVVSFEKKDKAHIILGTRGGPLYFYVPKNTDCFAFGWVTEDKYGKIVIKDKDGNIMLDEEGNYTAGEEFIVQVPKELQGSIFSLEISKCEDSTKLYLSGIPPYLSHDPNKILVPKDVEY